MFLLVVAVAHKSSLFVKIVKHLWHIEFIRAKSQYAFLPSAWRRRYIIMHLIK